MMNRWSEAHSDAYDKPLGISVYMVLSSRKRLKAEASIPTLFPRFLHSATSHSSSYFTTQTHSPRTSLELTSYQVRHLVITRRHTVRRFSLQIVPAPFIHGRQVSRRNSSAIAPSPRSLCKACVKIAATKLLPSLGLNIPVNITATNSHNKNPIPMSPSGWK